MGGTIHMRLRAAILCVSGLLLLAALGPAIVRAHADRLARLDHLARAGRLGLLRDRDLLRHGLAAAVGLGGVEESNAVRQRVVHDGEARGLVDFASEGRAAEADSADLQAC